MKTGVRALAYAGGGFALLTIVTLALRTAPIVIEVAPVTIGPLEVVTEDQGETRAYDRYVVAAPIAGRLLRVLLRDGDAVDSGQQIAIITPLPLSARERDELKARVSAAEAIHRATEAQLSHVMEDLAQAERETSRLQELYGRSLVSQQQLEQAKNASITLDKEVIAARYRVKSAMADVQVARAGLTALDTKPQGEATTVSIRAPASGRVLRVLEQSERVVLAGTPILMIGDLGHLEVVMEMLSSEAVKVNRGMPALLDGWGGERPLRARVRVVEPYAFTKISALGVEEKRTRVLLDFVDPPAPLADGYRVIGRITIWSDPRVVKVPIASLFRCGASWCVFVLDRNHVQQREIKVAHHNEVEAEVLSGVRPGDTVVRHPPNELHDGSRVSAR